MQDISCYARTLVQICVWREAQDVPEAWAAVTWVILNRALKLTRIKEPPMSLDIAIQHVVTAPYQFSSMTVKGDVNTIKWPLPSMVWNAVAKSVDAVLGGVTPDPTGGATFYFSPPLIEAPSTWGTVVQTGTFGSIQTFKESA